MADFITVADGLRFPEGPVWLPDGSIVLVEIAAGRITRIAADGSRSVVATPGGGPNGLAIGPDGALYCCNNGGFNWHEAAGFLAPHGQADDYSGGRIERIDLATGKVEPLFADGDFGCSLRGPNDIVFDGEGGFWFTDHGKTRTRERDVTGIFYAKADGSHLAEIVFPSENPNGVGLSPDRRTLYAAETYTCRLMKFTITAPGEVDATAGLGGRGHRSTGRRGTSSSIRSASRRAATSASRRSARAGSASSRPTANWSTSSRPTTPSPPTSAGAAPT